MIFLEVPFREKDQAKSLGARWDSASKKWYVPTELLDQQASFQKWLSPVQTQPTATVDSSTIDLFSANSATPTDEVKKGTQLSSVLKNVQNALRASFPGAIWVIAEIANLNERRGHIYLELTESNQQGQPIANCRAMIWQSQAERMLNQFELQTGSRLTTGQKVLLLAEVSFHEQYGFSFVIQDIDPSYTLGEVEANLNNIRKQLVKEGIYSENKRFTLPADYFRIAVIAPPAAAGLGDFRADADILQKSGLCEFKYFYCAFQGEAVVNEMTTAFNAMHALHATNPFDALVIIRGGGAKLDLNMLNVYALAKQICLAKLPVLTGIGHERDNSILDEVAHTRFDTPSKVIAGLQQAIFQQAQIAKQNWQHIDKASRLWVRQYQNRLNVLNHDILQNSQSVLFRWKERLQPLKYQLQRRCDSAVQNANQVISELNQQVRSQVMHRLNVTKLQLEQQHQLIESQPSKIIEQKRNHIIQWIAFILSSGPKTQLNRGFVIAKTTAGVPIKTAKQAQELGHIQLQFVDGTLEANIDANQTINTKNPLENNAD